MSGKNLFLYLIRKWWAAVLLVPPLAGCFSGYHDGNGAIPFFQGVVFMGNTQIAQSSEVFAANFAGTALTKLSGTLVIDGSVMSMAVSPGRRKVAYVADQDTKNIDELYVVDTNGTNNTKVSGALVPGGDVVNNNWSWSPDGSKLAYLADQDTDNLREVYVVNADGTGNIKVSGTLPAGSSGVGAPLWSPDSSQLAYVADQGIAGVYELYVVNADGTNNTRINGPLVAGGQVDDLLDWSPDGSKLAYLADQDTAGVLELYVVNADGTGNIKLNGPLVAGGEVNNDSWSWSPDSSQFAYLADQDTDNVNELYVVNADGTNNIKVNGALVAGGYVVELAWSPDGSRLVYSAAQDTVNLDELYVVNADGTGNIKVNGTMAAGSFGLCGNCFRWSPDGSRLAYATDQDTAGLPELYVVNADGTNNIKVNGALVAGSSGIRLFAWSPDGSPLAYVADQDIAGVSELFLVNPDGTGNTKISGTVVAGGAGVSAFVIADAVGVSDRHSVPQ